MQSRTVRTQLKGDEHLRPQNISMSELIAKRIKQDLEKLPFRNLLTENTILVPAPSSSLLQRNSLWVPQRLARALVKMGLGKNFVVCLRRAYPIRKASTSPPEDRPKAKEHYDSMEIVNILDKPEEILLVDDVVTRGSTILGAANKLADAFPTARIRAFAAMRTISNPDEFQKIIDPCIGTIELRGIDTFRRP